MSNLDLEYLVRREQYQDIQRDVARSRWLSQIERRGHTLRTWQQRIESIRGVIATAACRLPALQIAPYCRVSGLA